MRCHYEVLEVERDSEFDQIKLAYRKLALKWHPDKNPTNQEEAAEKFKEVQAAYTVLSDVQERAWYDSHRESILRGIDDAEGEELHNINLWGFFSSSCFSGYDINEENNFYSVYGNLFAELDRHEEMEEFTDEYHEKRPPFGGPDATYNDLLNFYSTWEAFCSRKSFSWKDKYRLSDAPMRKIKRLMEKENKKLRNAARKKYNEEVRALARFVKKRDVRWEACVKEFKEKELEKQNEILNKKKIANENKKKKLQEIQKAYEEELDSLDLEEIGISTTDLDGENEDKEEFYCFACKKAFRSNNQWLNHEKSKKHLEMVDVLRSSVMLDDEVFDPQASKQETQADVEENSNENEEENEEENGEGNGERDVEVGEVEKKVEQLQVDEEIEIEDDEEIEARPNPAGMASKRNKKKKKKQQQRNVRRFVEEEEEENPEPPKEEHTEETKEAEEIQELPVQEENQGEEQAPVEEEEEAAPLVKKKKARRAKKNTKNNQAPQQATPVEKTKKNFDDELTCVTCGVSFVSRNKLFSHVKEKKHAQPLPSTGGRRK